jgi:peptide deformylase
MVKPLIIYPKKHANPMLISEVRKFDKEIIDIIQDMQDTMEEHNLMALSATQINHLYQIILIKEKDGTYQEYINPRVINSSQPFDSTESTLYYPNVEVTVPRYSDLKLIYENRNGESKHAHITDKEIAVALQRKIDYLYGGDLLLKVSDKRREEIHHALATNGLIPDASLEVCPRVTPKEYLLSFNDKIIFFMGLSLLTPLFSFEKDTIESIFLYDKIGILLVIGLMAGYFLMAQAEAKEFRQCTSCQVGNNIGLISKRVALALILFIGSYFLLN